MLAAFVTQTSPTDPLSCLQVGERPRPEAPEGWVRVRLEAASLNHHDLWSLRGVGLPDERLPMVLGCDGAGVDEDGRDVLVHAVVTTPGWTGDETLDPGRSLLSERYAGTLAEEVVVPARNVVPRPPELSAVEAACLPTAWLTAYRMLVTQSGAAPGSTVLVQGAGGGVATALVVLGRAAGYRVWVTSRSEAKRERALALGAHAAFAAGERLPGKVDAVMETVGEATWAHSLRALRPGGTVVVAGATSGPAPSAELQRVFFLGLRVVGTTMGTRDELVRLLDLLVATGARPVVDRELPLERAAEGLAAMEAGELFGKVVLRPAG
ncbi:zinc-binding dehydrogenase [uncultured Pseudokineococcus sp.]|uniref:zinc-binding dehydrogenase n=1 Tax=uncultured Pseudokineococcus sp. TaxID=1642928 RepID=UPI00260957A0|nr:zinc-binding dehydrogenase [uncultured Pseudokineococcus sp.]